MSGPSLELNNYVVRAGAGAGKTTNLAETVVDVASNFYKHHSSLPKLVVTTFTRKATEELRERITTELFKKDRSDIMGLVQSKQHLQISTIHGVLSLFLRQYGQLMGLEAGFSVTDTDASMKLSKRVLHEVIQGYPSALDLMELYSFEQLLDILMQRRRKKIENPKLIAFNKEELLESVKEIIGKQIADLDRVLTLVIDETINEKWVNYAEHFRACLSEAEKDFDVQQALDKVKKWGSKPGFTKKKPPFSDSLNDEFTTVKNNFEKLAGKMGLNPKYLDKYTEAAELIDELGSLFDKALKQEKYSSGLIDSEDLELFTLEILRSEPELGSAFASSWDYWLVDEYQDTSPTQVEIMSKLRGDRAVYLVGDPQQSIYLFRGARIEVFEKEESRIVKAGGKAKELQKNYRSRPELLQAINDIVHDLGKDFAPMLPRDETYDPSEEVLQLIKSSLDDDKKYQGIINYIAEKISNGAQLDDFCVLAKANSTLLKVCREFEASGLPCSVHAASGYYSRREVIDMLSMLKFLVNPHDKINLVRLLKTPWFRLADEKIIQIKDRSKASYWISLVNNFSDDVRVLKLQEALKLSSQVGYIEAFRSLLFESGLVDLSHWHDSTGRRESNIWKLLTDLRAQERLSGFNPVDLFRKFERAMNKLDDESDAVASKEPNRINLMTIHKSKGLKFKYVIIPNMEKSFRGSDVRGHEMLFVEDDLKGRWSTIAPVGDKAEYKHSAGALVALESLAEREKQESMRLLYVAVTRAEEGICFHAEFDDAPKENSWASQLNVWKLEPGVTHKKYYSISVQHSPFEKLQFTREKEKAGLAVRPLLEEKISTGSKQRFSVTSLIENLDGAEASESRAHSLEQVNKSIKAPSLGSILHSVFERMKYQENFDFKGYLANKLGDEAGRFIESVEYVSALNDPPMSELIQNGQVEWGFQVKTAKGILEGQIDLWAQLNNEVWVVDYKSGNTKYSDKAFLQLEYYAWALNKAFGFDKFKLAIVYPLSKEIKTQTLSSLEHLSL